MEHHPPLDNGVYDVVDRAMRPLALTQARQPRSDREKARHFISSTSAHHSCGSLSRQEDDDKDDGASRASAPSPTTYLNSFKPLNYQQYEIPSPSEQSDDLLFKRQTELLNQSQELHKEVRGRLKSFGKALRGVFGKKKNFQKTKNQHHFTKTIVVDLTQDDTKTSLPKHQLSSPSAPNAPSKKPSTKDTSSYSIDYTSKSPTSFTSPPTNGYLNSPKSPPSRVPPPPPTQENVSIDITLTLSPITPPDVQFDNPSPSKPIFGRLVPWNLLEAHGDSCLCCIHNRTLIFELRDELQCMFSHIEYMLSQPPLSISPPPPSLSPN
uniref:Uncharacterized protein n=1 Tax=Tanacetum cinerariifolium TaxID=118510 RepID=A0A6L2LDW8_TANCI|nr:hypothetical protein [Tanacetum cinerariifolium]